MEKFPKGTLFFHDALLPKENAVPAHNVKPSANKRMFRKNFMLSSYFARE